MDAMGQKNNAMTEYGHVTNKYVYYINSTNQEEYFSGDSCFKLF